MFVNNKLLNIFKVASFFLFVFALVQILTPLKLRIYDSEWLFMYSCCILGYILGFVGNKSKDTILVINKMGKVAMYGNLIIAILFFPPLYFIWGTLLEGFHQGFLK